MILSMPTACCRQATTIPTHTAQRVAGSNSSIHRPSLSSSVPAVRRRGGAAVRRAAVVRRAVCGGAVCGGARLALDDLGELGVGLGVRDLLLLPRPVQDTPLHLARPLELALAHEEARRLGQEEHAQREEHVGRRAQADHPAPLAVDAGEEVVDDVREQDTQRERHLGEGDQRAAPLLGRHLGDEHGVRVSARVRVTLTLTLALATAWAPPRR